MEKHSFYADGRLVKARVFFDRDTFWARFEDGGDKNIQLRGLAINCPTGANGWHYAYKRVISAASQGKECGYYLSHGMAS